MTRGVVSGTPEFILRSTAFKNKVNTFAYHSKAVALARGNVVDL